MFQDLSHFSSRELITLNVRGTKFMVQRYNLLRRFEGSLLNTIAKAQQKADNSETEQRHQNDTTIHEEINLSDDTNGTTLNGSSENSNNVPPFKKKVIISPLCADTNDPLELYFDRNPSLVNSILDSYISGEMHIPDNMCSEALKNELSFWKLEPEILAPCCWNKLSR